MAKLCPTFPPQLQHGKMEFPGKQPINHLPWISFSCVYFFWTAEGGERTTLMENLKLGFPIRYFKLQEILN